MTKPPRMGLIATFAAASGDTWKDLGIAAFVLDKVRTLGLWFDFQLMGIGKGDEPLVPDRLDAAARTWTAGTLRALGGPSVDYDSYFDAEITGSLFKVRLRPTKLDGNGRAMLDGMIALIRAITVHGGERIRPTTGCVYPMGGLRYPLRRPPLQESKIRFGTLTDFIGVTWMERSLPDQVDALTSAGLPPGASRVREGDLAVLRWTDDPSDREEQARACIRQEDWWAERLEVDLPPGWNAAGDRAVDFDELEPGRRPFTLFDAGNRIGYRAVVVMPDGELAGTSWEELADLVRQGRLDDGTPVEKVRLLVPVRDNALAIAEHARSLGIDAVLYKGEDDMLWNPMPPGDWRTQGATQTDRSRS